jgi:hypothetical protein
MSFAAAKSKPELIWVGLSAAAGFSFRDLPAGHCGAKAMPSEARLEACLFLAPQQIQMSTGDSRANHVSSAATLETWYSDLARSDGLKEISVPRPASDR